MQLFRPKIRVPEPPGPPPTIDEAAARQDQTDKIRRRKGAASTVLVPDAMTKQGAVSTVLGG